MSYKDLVCLKSLQGIWAWYTSRWIAWRSNCGHQFSGKYRCNFA